MNAPASRARCWPAGPSGERHGGPPSRRLWRAAFARPRVRVAVITAAVIIGSSSSALACPVCFGAEETSIIEGTKLGVLVLLGITLAVQGAFVGFFLYLRNRAKLIAEVDLETEWSQLQRGSRTS